MTVDVLTDAFSEVRCNEENDATNGSEVCRFPMRTSTICDAGIRKFELIFVSSGAAE